MTRLLRGCWLLLIAFGVATAYAQEPQEPEDSMKSEVAELEPAVKTDGSEPEPRPGRTQDPVTYAAMDHMELDQTSIIGNRELPRVMYIVPWKKADMGDLMGRPVNSLLDEVLKPVDRDVFRRHLDYYEELTEPTDEAEISD